MMRRFAAAGALLVLCAATASPQPVAPVRPVTTDYFGTTVVDPYRWMESGGPQFDAYLRAQNAYTRGKLDAIDVRPALIASMKATVVAAGPAGALDQVATAANRLFLTRLPQGGAYHALYVRETGRERLLYDPNLEPPERRGEILIMSPAPDGRHVAVGVAGGSEKSLVHIVDVDSGAVDVENAVPFVGYAFNWRDASSFYYMRTVSTSETRVSTTLLHRIGTDMERDDVAIAGPGVASAIPQDPIQQVVITAVPPRWAIAEATRGTESDQDEVYVAPLASVDSARAPWRKLTTAADEVKAVAASGDTLYGLTSNGAPLRRVFRTALDRPSPLETVVPEGTSLLTDISAFANRVYVAENDGSSARLRAFDAELRPVPLPLPPLDSVAAPAGSFASTTLAIDGAAYDDPRRIFTLDLATGRVTDSGVTPAAPPIYASLRVTETFAKSADGTMVPLTIVAKGEPKRDGSAPVVLLGYGSYGATPYVPPIPPTYVGMVNAGVVLAIAHVRGGGELGQRWYLDGKGPNKHHSIEDFLACARRLVADGWTSPAHLAALGESAGGIVVGRAMTQDPSLFAAVVSQVGVSDTLRMENTPNGKGNIPELGTAATEAGFRALYEMSPYEHVVPGTRYPAFLMTTGLSDPRVAPWQVAKFEARVQAATASGKPVLIRVDENAGHGFGDSLDAQYAELADVFGFILWQEHVDVRAP